MAGTAGGTQRTARKRAATSPKKKTTTTRKRTPKAPERPWLAWTMAVIAAVAAIRLAVNATGWVPVHFDEAQYWAYGQEFAAGHFSKPPLVGWVIRIATELGGDTTFALRVASVLSHAGVAVFVFLAGRLLFDGRTGFWAATGYTVAPGVSVSAMIMSTDPVLMAFWALALWAWIRAAEGDRAWWVLMGVAIGAGLLAKYTMIAFAGGALGYGLFSARERDWRGAAIAAAVALVVFSPNLIWQIDNDFVTTVHVAEDAAPAGSRMNPGKLAEFLGAQFGVIGPVWFLAILAALFGRSWWGDWRMRLLGWQIFPLLIPITVVAFVTRAQPNWAAPAYVAGSIFAAHWLLSRGWDRALRWQAVAGALGAIGIYFAAAAYAFAPLSLPRGPDPFKKMRLGEEFCAAALGAMAEESADAILSNDRRRLSECMFLGNLLWQDIAIWNPDPWPENHHELVASLAPGDERVLIIATMSREGAARMASRFRESREIETARFRTHADQEYTYSLWVVQGFRGY